MARNSRPRNFDGREKCGQKVHGSCCEYILVKESLRLDIQSRACHGDSCEPYTEKVISGGVLSAWLCGSEVP